MSGKKVATFQERFIELIDSSPKSQTTIAREFGVAKQTISAWYTGQSSPRIPVVSSLAEYFGVSLDWLNGFDVPKYPKQKDDAMQEYVSRVLEYDKNPRTPEGIIISGGIDRMPEERRKQALKILQAAFIDFAQYFKEDPRDDDT